MKLIMRNIMRW